MTSSEIDSRTERDLERHFASMRTEDSGDLPPFPDFSEQAVHEGSNAQHGRRATLLRLSLAAAVLLAVGILVTGQAPGEDPAALYAKIISSYSLETDQLLSVSEGMSPEMTGVPDMMTPGLVDDIDTLAN